MEKRIENHPILGESPKGKLVKFSYDGTTLEGYEGEPIAAALRVAGVMANVRTCITPLKEGMVVETQYGASAKEEA